MKKIYTTFICLIFLINFAYALEFDNVMYEIDVNEGDSLDIGGENEPYNNLWKKYKPIRIMNNFGFGQELFKGSITKHKEHCGNNCESELKIKLTNDDVLIQDIRFLKNSFDNWNEVSIRSYKLEYKKGNNWIEFEVGEEFKKGNYKIRISGEKNPSWEVDWQIKTQGIWVEPWAVWATSASVINFNSTEVEIGTCGTYIKVDEIILENSITYNYTGEFRQTPTTSGSARIQFIYEDSSELNFTTGTITSSVYENYSLENPDKNKVVSQINTYLLRDCISGSYMQSRNRYVYGINTSHIVLNSPENNQVIETENVDFNADIIITNGATIKNISFWDNMSGNILINNFTSGIVASYAPELEQEANGGTFVLKYTFEDINTTVDRVENQIREFTSTYVGSCKIKFNYKNGSSYEVVQTTSSTAYAPKTYINLFKEEIVDNIQIFLAQTGSAIDIRAKENNVYGFEPSNTTFIHEKSYSSGDVVIWNLEVCDSDGDCGLGVQNNTFIIDSAPPIINITSPSGVLNYNYVGGTESLNWTVSDTNIDSCWYNYNGTNITTNCNDNQTYFILEEDNFNITFYANDTAGNVNSSFSEWAYTYFENSRTYNTTSYETAGESFIIDADGVSSATLFYNGTEYTTTKSGSIFSRTLQIPAGQLGNKSIYWKFDGVQDSFISYQDVSEIIFTLCNSTYQTVFVNISFKDENDLSVINASISSSTFTYYLGDGSASKTYNLINNTENYNYEFCVSEDVTLKLDSFLQYKKSGYPQRIYNQDGAQLTNDSSDVVLYLLNQLDGQYVTFQVFSGQVAALQGVDVTGTRSLGGSEQTVAQGTTDAAGTVTFFMNNNFLHTMTFVKSGFVTVIEQVVPTLTLYTITMGGGTSEDIVTESEGVVINIFPQGSFIDSNTFYNFQYKINSTVLSLDGYGFDLLYKNGTIIDSQSGLVESGSTLSTSFDTGNNTKLIMNYYYITNSTRTNGTTSWLVSEDNDYSIFHFFERADTYMSQDLYGILGDDDGYFSKAIISILILMLSVGMISIRYGLGSEAAVTGVMFGIVFMLNMFNFIPTPDFLTFINLGDFLVFILAMLTISTIIRTEGRF